jgi:predicted ArsR family transcriptional regulator
MSSKTTAEKILAYLDKHPKMRVKDVAEHFNVHTSYIYAVRRKFQPVAQAQEVFEQAIEDHLQRTSVDKVLDDRAKDYGKFIEGAEIMQMLKRMVHGYIEKRGTPLAFDQREAIDMMIHKLGRVINGNPDKVDHWTDIAGYATLVAERLEGNAR